MLFFDATNIDKFRGGRYTYGICRIGEVPMSKRIRCIWLLMFLLISFVGVGYASIATSVNINGTGVIKAYTPPKITVSDLVANANPATLSYTDSTDAQKGNLYTINQEYWAISSVTNYRYIGEVPNNYIDFNNETWRIIGVIDGKLKIIRNESIGTMAWDLKQNGVGSSTTATGSDDWRDSQLMYMLNPNASLLSNYNRVNGVITDKNGRIVYKEGKLPALVSTTSTEYPADAGDTPWGLNAVAQNQAVETTYYTVTSGAPEIESVMSAGYLWYRETTKTSAVNGKVGLMYASDYAYTFAAGVNDGCYSSIDSSSDMSIPIPGEEQEVRRCENSWLNSSYDEWTMTGMTQNGRAYKVGSGDATEVAVNNIKAVRPVVYLNPDIKLTGTGTSTNHYKIVS